MVKLKLKLAILILISFISCKNPTANKLKNGIWHAEMIIQNKKVPFLFEVKNSPSDSVSVTLQNGSERLTLIGLSYQKDTVIIPVEIYDAVLKAVISEDSVNGLFLKNFIPNDPGIPFRAIHGKLNRFEAPESPSLISPQGKWDILFVSEKGDTTANAGIFNLTGETVTGSVLTRTGDLRFLEGSLTRNGFQLSAFSGLSPYLFEMEFEGNDKFYGIFYTSRSKTSLIGRRNQNASLGDPYQLTTLKKGLDKIEFTFANENGKPVSTADERYKGKVVILSILGSWCPNCLDELKFLSSWYLENSKKGVEIIGLAFERKADKEYVSKSISNLKKRYNVAYEILFAGTTSEESKAKALPAIQKIMGFPTTIFIDKKGKVRKIHTGFNGPATGEYFEEFKREFNDLINELINE